MKLWEITLTPQTTIVLIGMIFLAAILRNPEFVNITFWYGIIWSFLIIGGFISLKIDGGKI